MVAAHIQHRFTRSVQAADEAVKGPEDAISLVLSLWVVPAVAEEDGKLKAVSRDVREDAVERCQLVMDVVEDREAKLGRGWVEGPELQPGPSFTVDDDLVSTQSARR